MLTFEKSYDEALSFELLNFIYTSEILISRVSFNIIFSKKSIHSLNCIITLQLNIVLNTKVIASCIILLGYDLSISVLRKSTCMLYFVGIRNVGPSTKMSKCVKKNLP